jgi:hypothetical protein
MADLCIRLAKEGGSQDRELRWSRFFGGQSAGVTDGQATSTQGASL